MLTGPICQSLFLNSFKMPDDFTLSNARVQMTLLVNGESLSGKGLREPCITCTLTTTQTSIYVPVQTNQDD